MAEREARRLNETHPDRPLFRWVALSDEKGAWSVLRTPRGTRVDPLKATTAATPPPPAADDPRPQEWRDAPPF